MATWCEALTQKPKGPINRTILARREPLEKRENWIDERQRKISDTRGDTDHDIIRVEAPRHAVVAAELIVLDDSISVLRSLPCYRKFVISRP